MTELHNGKMDIAEGCSYSLHDLETHLNNNVLVVGGSGTGKTRTIVTPNLHRAWGSYVIAYMIETGYAPCNFSSILKLVREGSGRMMTARIRDCPAVLMN